MLRKILNSNLYPLIWLALVAWILVIFAAQAQAQGAEGWNGQDLVIGCQYVTRVTSTIEEKGLEAARDVLPAKVDDAVRMGICYGTIDSYREMGPVMKGAECLVASTGVPPSNGELIKVLLEWYRDGDAQEYAFQESPIWTIISAVEETYCKSQGEVIEEMLKEGGVDG